MAARVRRSLSPHVFFAVLAGVCVACAAAGPRALVALAYQRDAILRGQAWRLLTAHVVHLSARHLAWNLAGLALPWLVFARRLGAAAWSAVAVAAGLAASLGMLMLHPEVRAMAGLSAVVHGLMAAGGVAEVRRGRRLAWLFLAALAAKLVFEQLGGPVAAGFLGGTIAVDAHAWAAMAGALAALAVRLPR